jgi:hypothetical protein
MAWHVVGSVENGWAAWVDWIFVAMKQHTYTYIENKKEGLSEWNEYSMSSDYAYQAIARAEDKSQVVISHIWITRTS